MPVCSCCSNYVTVDSTDYGKGPEVDIVVKAKNTEGIAVQAKYGSYIEIRVTLTEEGASDIIDSLIKAFPSL